MCVSEVETHAVTRVTEPQARGWGFNPSLGGYVPFTSRSADAQTVPCGCGAMVARGPSKP